MVATGGGYNATNAFAVLLGNGDGTFQAAINTSLSFFPAGLVIADFNQDGNLDIATSYGGSSSPEGALVLLFGNGNGSFQVQQPLSILGVPVVAGDVKPDLLIGSSNGAATLQSLLNNGDGTFTIVQSSLPGRYTALFDLFGNHKADSLRRTVLFRLCMATETELATFPSYPGGASVAADFNGDSRIDVANSFNTLSEGIGYDDFIGVSLNTGNGFSTPTQIQIQGQTSYPR